MYIFLKYIFSDKIKTFLFQDHLKMFYNYFVAYGHLFLILVIFLLCDVFNQHQNELF